MKVETFTEAILIKMSDTGKVQRKFIISMCKLFLMLRGRYNFLNFARYGLLNELTYRLNFNKGFDFRQFNSQLITQYCSEKLVWVFDPSYLPKSGKHTPGVGYFWSGCAGAMKKGLEICGLAVADLVNHTAFHYHAGQTDAIKGEQNLLAFYAKLILRQVASLKKVSKIARLGSGSACRSMFPTMAAWGVCPEIEGSNDEYAVGFEADIQDVFKTYHDTILIASRGEKSVSSRMGHGLMENNPFAAPRYQQAHERMTAVVSALRSGDVETFGQIAEDEAMSLHALMMTSSPNFTLLKPNTLRMIEILRGWREATKLPAYFSLDAGPNLHLLYPDFIKKEVNELIVNELQPLCEDEMVIFDNVGQGATRK